ncbi:dihydroneopterin aldolase [Parabacteroides sp. 52]|uniref:dihydroneopterin aldolase n=1 Tax=unclassified Parabacteroides TaxID=2649774 RepID=UPI0013D3973E|nr:MULTISPECIES: dihydroneopterin aldolase [unclassified Parabacteroides]MDH6535026.1 dihydroneopterin aldolase [Parabacteroides sp. PM5-20]NDV55286.1 dihydroneopterin aldolase [Parabacteroides sp. 52]
MTTKIELEAMKFYAYHGVAEQERRVGNHFVVDLVLTAPLEKAVMSDDLKDTINYATVYALVKQEMAVPSRLLEHAAGRILTGLKRQFPQLLAIEIKLAKQTPPFGGDVRSAAVLLSETYLS